MPLLLFEIRLWVSLNINKEKAAHAPMAGAVKLWESVLARPWILLAIPLGLGRPVAALVKE